MKKIWSFLKHHLQQDFHAKHYFSVALLLITLLIINYTFDFEDSYLDSLIGFRKFLNYLLMYSVAFYSSVALYVYFQKKDKVFSSREFWIKSIFGLSILSLDGSMPYLQTILEDLVPSELLLWTFKLSVNLLSFVTVFIPILIFYFIYEKHDEDVYGLKPKQFDPKPYLIMLLIMIPMLMAASNGKSFLRQYPMYKTSLAHEYLGVDESLTVAAYEIAYGLDFITVEYLFRGFFVLAFFSTLGRGAVLSMAVIYCCLHFGKPMGEAISSIFGGFLLGIVAFETRSVWGGVIVHVGIAWSMELIAYIQKTFVQ
jgi:hypothetical protein